MELISRLILVSGFVLIVSGCANDVVQSGSFTEARSVQCQASKISGQYLVRWKDGHLSTAYASDDETFKNGFLEKNREKILFAEPDYSIVSAPETNLADEFNTDGDVSAFDTNSGPNWGAVNIGADKVWPQGYKGQGVVVAVIDSGVDITHPQLRRNIFVNQAELNGQPGVDDDGNGFVDDVNGWNFVNNTPNQGLEDDNHGTHVSGTIAADPDAGAIWGIAPQAKILPIDFINGAGSSGAAISGLLYAVKMGANVINASWGSSSCSENLKATFKSLETENVVIVVAAGNSGNDITYEPEYPAAFIGINELVVAALDPSNYLAPYSNFGSLVHIAAPGSYIWSTVKITSKNPDGYEEKSGTSMATPHVAGAAALLLSKRITASPPQVIKALKSGADPVAGRSTPSIRLRVDKSIATF